MPMKTIQRRDLLERIVALKFTSEDLPALPPNEQVKLEHDIAVDHLYNSSALEGSRLSDDQIRSATREGFSPAN